MLSSETKRKIDNARDILVGKIPVPSAQIELITIALIYKFMSDIDTQNKELGADGFFVGEYEKYSWSNIMDRKIGAHDRLYLYSEWLDKIGTNPHLPQMFRDIFRNAFLPFKDPQTLDRFLKQINEFHYDHSEELGNAFEYLLSTAGSQWDAGQFRTPRHIIDFIVQVVEPKYTDTILDPACGTAGFLISAYKYILNQNKDKVPWDKLTLTQKNTLTKNFVGYDISHEMVRLSLVNLYLHNFWDPHVYEYDTLSSDERRDDRFDCILANPPFMTPKWWIQPHSRFSITASKSEVLFVDYMMEHLNPHEKAGIIVPEGIIFQSANAYKALRKKMIEENHLRAVVSLPSGVFQPYSWVKTSILLFDKELAKKSDSILFVKVNNDGFDLWAQRRESTKNDLPIALEELLEYKKTGKIKDGLLVPKSDIIANGDYNLSMERYRIAEIMNSDRPMVELGEVVDIINWSTPLKSNNEYRENGTIPWFTIDDIRTQGRQINYTKQFITAKALKETSIKLLPKNAVLLCCTASVGEYAITNIETCTNQQFNGLIIKAESQLLPKFLFYIIATFKEKLLALSWKTSFDFISWWSLKKIKIPLPPLEVQEQIIAELDGYQKIIDGAKMVVDNYKPNIKIDPEWEMVELGDENYVKIIDWDRWTNYPKKEEFTTEWYCLFLNTSNVRKWFFDFSNCDFITKERDEKLSKWKLSRWDAVLTTRWTLWNTAYFENKIPYDNIRINSWMVILRPNKNNFSWDYLLLFLNSQNFTTQIESFVSWSAQPQLPIRSLSQFKIPLPPIDIQQQIVTEIEKEQAMVESAKGLVDVFEGKVKERIGEVWGE